MDEIVARHMQALGGREKLNSIHSVVEHLEYREASFVFPNAFVARMRPYYKTLGDPKITNVEINEGYDGSAWEYHGDPGVVIRVVGAAAAATRHGTEMFDSLVDYKALGTRVDLSGVEEFAGRPAYKLHVTLADGFEKELFVDQQSNLIIGDRRSAPIHAFGEPVRSENHIGDYRPVSGVLSPFSIKEVEIATGRELNSNTVQSLEVNKILDPSFFSPPQYQRTPLQQMLEQLYLERTDPALRDVDVSRLSGRQSGSGYAKWRGIYWLSNGQNGRLPDGYSVAQGKCCGLSKIGERSVWSWPSIQRGGRCQECADSLSESTRD